MAGFSIAQASLAVWSGDATPRDGECAGNWGKYCKWNHDHTKDTLAPTVKIINPVAGNVSGRVTIAINASDNAGAAGIVRYIYVDGAMVASGTGSTLSYAWNTRGRMRQVSCITPGQ
jgi:hypothetical protein